MDKTSTVTRKNERSKHSISLENFGQRKGQVRALAEFRNRKQRKRIETAKALRKYKKTMKSEGFDAGRGASRRRVGDREGTRESDGSEEIEKAVPARRQKTNPFQKSIDKAKLKKETAENMIKIREDNQKEKQRKLRERKQQSKLLARRTKRGQPIMKHAVGNILRKLENK